MNESQFEELIDRVQGYLPQYAEARLQKSKSGLYDCPFCNSGNKEKGTGALGVWQGGDGKWRWKCQACGEYGDLLDLIGHFEGISGKKEQLLYAARIYGIDTDGIDGGGAEWKPKRAPQPLKKREEAKKEESEPEPDFTEFLEEARRHIGDPECVAYLHGRGISLATASKLGWGFCAEWRHPKVPLTVPASPRLIMPTSAHSYAARSITDKDYKKAGKQRAMNLERALFQEMEPLPEAKPAYIVEGEIDAASIIEVGGEAVALGSTANANKFLEELGDRKPRATLVLSLDTDEAGRRKEDELARELEARGIPFYRWNVAESDGGAAYKDANEALVAGRNAFKQRVHEGMSREREELKAFHERKEARMAEQKTGTAEQAANGQGQEETKDGLMKMSVSARARGFAERTRGRRDERRLSTGFKALDEALRGGLYPGLYILGGGTSVGKTAFMLQIADTIARAEHEAAQELGEQGKARHGILYFSLETGADELLARSVSRISRSKNKDRPIDGNTGKDGASLEYADILDGFRADGFEGERYGEAMALFDKCLAEHEAYGGFEFIHESVAGISIDNIVKGIEAFKKQTGMKPVVFVDYLQIIPHDDIVSDKRAVDASIIALKRAARECDVPIIAASSINRASYGEDVGMASYKESGGIEFTADVLLGLQWKDGAKIESNMKTDQINKAVAEAEAKNRRSIAPEVTVKVIKNRRGGAYKRTDLTFEKPYAYFSEGDSPRVNDMGGRKKWG